MKINKLFLYNFGIFSGSNELDFICDNPIILIGGMNGRGKTTLLEAVLFALYGRRSFALGESGLSLPQYLRQRVNTTNSNSMARIELEFSLLENGNNNIYTIQREWDLFQKTPEIKTTVQKNKVYDKLLADNWDLFIEELLPSTLAPFFFFDGEKISELANSDNDSYMKDSIKVLLGINIVETAINDVQRIIKKQQENPKYRFDLQEIEQFELKFSEADKNLKASKEDIGLLNAKRIQIENKLRKAEDKFVAIGGNLASNRQDMQKAQIQLDEKLAQLNTSLIDFASGDLPLLMVLPLLQKILTESVIEKEQQNIQTVLEKLPTLLNNYNKEKTVSLEIDDFISFIKANTNMVLPKYKLTDKGVFRLQTLCYTLATTQLNSLKNILLEKVKVTEEKIEIANYLSVSVNEKEANKYFNSIITLKSDLADIKEKLRLSAIQEDYYKTQYDELLRQKTKVIEDTVSKLEDNDDSNRTLIYSSYLLNVFHEYKLRLQAKKTNQLASTITDCFNKLVSKRTLLNRILIDEKTLHFQYFNSKDEEISHSSFSAGEKQLLVIAMLWALGICSGKNFPIIVDTPLARLDSVHRKALVKNYFPKVCDQIILLSTDEEIYGDLYQQLKPHIGKEYTLDYNDEAKCSLVESGYFGGSMK